MAGNVELRTSVDRAQSMPVTTPTGGVTKGEVITVGSVHGFVFDSQGDATINTLEEDVYTFMFKAEKVEADKDAASIDQGALVYWDGVSVTASASGNQLVGVCIEAAAAGDSTVLMTWDGMANNYV